MSFFVACEDFGGSLMIHSLPALFFFFLKWYQLTHTPLLGQDQSTVAQQAETIVAECFLMSYIWASFSA